MFVFFKPQRLSDDKGNKKFQFHHYCLASILFPTEAHLCDIDDG